MSSQRGNVKKTGPPKHKNKTAFKNTLHDTSKRSQELSNMHVTNCCKRCTDIIEWKIKYKKYKPLTQPKKCTLCHEKTVKKAYTLVCQPCAQQAAVCIKCGEKKDDVHRVVELTAQEQARQQSELCMELRQLTERRRRTFHRFQQKGQLTEEHCSVTEPDKRDLSESDEEHGSLQESDKEHDSLEESDKEYGSLTESSMDRDHTLSGDDKDLVKDDTGVLRNVTSDLNEVSLDGANI